MESHLIHDDKIYHFKGNGILSNNSLIYFDDTNTKFKINFLDRVLEKEDNGSIFKLFYGKELKVDYFLKEEKRATTIALTGAESDLQQDKFTVIYHLAEVNSKFEFQVSFIREDL